VRDPVTREELEQAALSAEVLLRIHAAREYGLIEGGPDISVERCDELIARARAEGISFGPDVIDQALAHVVLELAGDTP